MKIFLLFAIFSLVPVSQTHYNCLDYYHQYSSSYMIGNVSETFDNNISYKDCGYYCILTDECRGFNYKNINNVSECELMSGLLSLEYNLNYTFFDKIKFTCYERQTLYYLLSFLIVGGFFLIIFCISRYYKSNENRISRAGYQQIL